MRPLLLLALAALAITACSVGRRASLGGECEINSDCDTPLICRVGFCRNECATSADCAAGLSCLLDENRLGICQLLEEASCTLPSECNAPLVCRFNQCTNECTEDRDCLGGARCRVDPLGNACIDPSSQPCVRDGECMRDEYCLSGRCRQQCFTDRDCRRGWRCDSTGAGARCVDPAVDGGPRDAGMTDVPARDAGGSPCVIGPLVGVQSFSLGSRFGCAITNDGQSHLFCWGDEADGARGTLEATLCATEVMPLRGIPMRQVAAGFVAACVLLGSGEIQCMGSNNFGALGRDMPAGMGGTIRDEVPRPIAGGVNADLLIGGSTSTRFYAAVPASGARVGWGGNAYGQLDGAMTDRGTPVAATTLAMATLLATGNRVTCGAVAGTPACFGFPGAGLGAGGGAVITGTTAIAVGDGFTCAADATRVYCWGSNIAGQLGDGTTIDHATRDPTMPLPRPAVALAAGYAHACALLDDGALWCWGDRQAFDPAGPAGPSVPMHVTDGVSAVDCGENSTCILQGTRLLCAGLIGARLGIGLAMVPTGFMDVVQ